MKITRIKISKTIADMTLKQGVSKSFAREVAAYLLENRRVNELNSILRDIQANWAEAGHVDVISVSAHPINANIKSKISGVIRRAYPNAKKTVVTEVHNTEVVGGVRLSLADQQLDLSVEAKLNKFKRLTTSGKG